MSSRSSAAPGATRRPTSRPTYAHDELRYAHPPRPVPAPGAGDADVPQQPAARPRCRSAAGARSCRRNGVGGAGVHWNGQTWRFLPQRLRAAQPSRPQRYGANVMPADMTIQDWGITYDELEPYYDKFEYLCGTSGKAGNLQGAKQHGRQPVRGRRARASIRRRR